MTDEVEPLDAPGMGASTGVGGATPGAVTSSPNEAGGERMNQKAIKYLLERFPQMLYMVEKDEDWTILKLNLGDIILSYADIEWLMNTPRMWEIEIFTENEELICYIYLEEEV
jgi:hypothetical protein